MTKIRCQCGRFARYDSYYDRWWCDRCDRQVAVAVSAKDDPDAARAMAERHEARISLELAEAVINGDI